MNVLIVDDHPMIREYLRGAAARALPDAVVRSVGTLREALEEARDRPPQLVLLDLGLPDATGLESILRFREAQPRIPVVVVSGEDDGDSVRGALALGAAGFVPKTSGPQILLNALRLVAEGGRYIPPETPRRGSKPKRTRDAALTKREDLHAQGPEPWADRACARHRRGYGEAALPRGVRGVPGVIEGRADPRGQPQAICRRLSHPV